LSRLREAAFITGVDCGTLHNNNAVPILQRKLIEIEMQVGLGTSTNKSKSNPLLFGTEANT
jgi:hypothetical protein